MNAIPQWWPTRDGAIFGWTHPPLRAPRTTAVVLVPPVGPEYLHSHRAVRHLARQLARAGYPGVPSLDILGNVVPFIGGEEEKMQTETQKILGTRGGRDPHPVSVSAHCNRVPVVDGHILTVSVGFEQTPSPAHVAEALRSFSGRPQHLGLPTAPTLPVLVMDEPNRPQPRLDAERGHGMTVTVGRIRPCEVLSTRFVVLGHNTVRGAAGAAILNAELMRADGLIDG